MTDPTESPRGSSRLRLVVTGPARLVAVAIRPLRYLPWPFPPLRDRDKEIARIQLNLLRKALGEAGGLGVHRPQGTRDHYLYRPGHALVREADLEAVQRFFAANDNTYDGVGEVERLYGDLTSLRLPRRRDEGDVPETLADLDAQVGPDVVRPDHVLFVTVKGSGKLCPAIEPRVPSKRSRGPFPAVNSEQSAGDGVRVSVVDSGWWAPAATSIPWLADDVGGEVETVDPTDIHPYAGHGTFVAGVIRCQAPSTTVAIEAILPYGGAAYESAIMKQLSDAMRSTGNPQLLSISAGTYTRNNRGLLAFEALAEAEKLVEGDSAVLVVAAAGNDSDTRPFWPAAYDWVVGVGSVDADHKVSSFSNTGTWVDVYALGRDLVNAFPTGAFTYHEPPLKGQVGHFKGLARWSGTSFSTPMVTGAIAAHLSAHGGTARDAYEALLLAGTSVTDPVAGPIVVL